MQPTTEPGAQLARPALWRRALAGFAMLLAMAVASVLLLVATPVLYLRRALNEWRIGRVLKRELKKGAFKWPAG